MKGKEENIDELISVQLIYFFFNGILKREEKFDYILSVWASIKHLRNLSHRGT